MDHGKKTAWFVDIGSTIPSGFVKIFSLFSPKPFGKCCPTHFNSPSLFHIALLLLLLSGLRLTAQKNPFSPSMQEAHKAMLQLRYEQMYQLTRAEKLNNPQNPIAHYIESSAELMDLILNKDQELYEKREDKFQNTLNLLENLPDNSPFKNHLISEFTMGMAALKFLYDERLGAGFKILKAHKLLKANYEKFPHFAPTQLLMGIFYAEVGSLPSNYQTVAGLFGFKANVKEGFRLMSEGYQKIEQDRDYSFLRMQYGMLYSYVNFMLTGSDSISPRHLALPFRSSALTLFTQAQIDLNHNKRREAFALMEAIPRSPGYRTYPFFDYHTGKAGMPFQPQKAISYFRLFINNTKNENFITSSYRYLCWHYLARGQMDSARLMQQAALKKGQPHTDEDQQALIEMQRPLNRYLIKAHLKFDAGRYAKAKNILEGASYKNDFSAAIEKTEFHYRMGRCLQELQKPQGAIFHYESAIKYSPGTHLMTANSALQAGILHKNINTDLARLHLENCLEMEGYPFEASVKQRAKTELEKL